MVLPEFLSFIIFVIPIYLPVCCRPHAPPPKLKAFGRTSISKNNSNMSSPAFDSSLCSSIAYTVSPPPYSPSGMALSQSSAEAGGGARTGATLLEQIIKSHPIWYLQHLGRAAANHLLRPMEPGVCLKALLMLDTDLYL